MLTLHQELHDLQRASNLINTVIATEPDLYTEPDHDRADDLLEEYYDAKGKGTKDKIRKKRDDALKSKPVYSSPMILAFVHAAVSANPELIPHITNSLYVERACSFMAGSYQYMLERVMAIPTVVVKYDAECFGKPDGISDVTKDIAHWVSDYIRATLVLIAQYGATGDTKYISVMKDWPIYKNVDVSAEYFTEILETASYLIDNKISRMPWDGNNDIIDIASARSHNDVKTWILKTARKACQDPQ